uniref:Uncharacterized protein n=1 Tax=Opuntia streptacantha TaxID=393608 RepID=A0A7C8YQJ8_OPUST
MPGPMKLQSPLASRSAWRLRVEHRTVGQAMQSRAKPFCQSFLSRFLISSHSVSVWTPSPPLPLPPPSGASRAAIEMIVGPGEAIAVISPENLNRREFGRF